MTATRLLRTRPSRATLLGTAATLLFVAGLVIGHSDRLAVLAARSRGAERR